RGPPPAGRRLLVSFPKAAMRPRPCGSPSCTLLRSWFGSERQGALVREAGHGANAAEIKQVGELRILVAPVMEQRLPNERVVPFPVAALVSREFVDACAPRRRGLALALHVGMVALLLRLGLDQVVGLLGPDHEVREIERRQPVFTDVAKTGETMLAFAQLAERFDAGVGLAPFDERALQPATS